MINNRLETLLQILESDGEDDFTLYAIALEYQKSDIQKSIEYFEKLLLLFPNYIGTYYQYGHLLKSKNDLITSELIFKKGIEIAIINKDYHALAELKQALNKLLGLDYEDE